MKHILLLGLFLFAITSPAQDKSINELRILHQKNDKIANNEKAFVESLLKIGDWHLKAMSKKAFPTSKDSSKIYIDKALSLSQKYKYPVEEGKCLLLYNEYHYQLYQDDQALKYANLALELFKKLKYNKGIADAYIRIARNYSGVSDAEYVPTAFKAKEIYKRLHDRVQEGYSTRIIAEMYNNLGDSKKTLFYAKESVKLFTAAKYKGEELINTYLILKLSYYYSGNIDEAFRYCLAAVHLAEQLDPTSATTANCYAHASTLYYYIGKNKQALSYIKKSLAINEQYTDVFTFITNTGSLVQILLDMKRSDEAITYLEKIQKYNVDFESRISIINKSIHAYTDTNQPLKAEKFVKEALVILKKSPESVILARLYVPIARYYYTIKDYEKARLFYNKYSSWAYKTKNKFNLQYVYGQLFIIDSIQSDFKSAIKNLKLHQKYKDSALNEASNKRVAELTIKYDLVKKDKDLTVKENNNKLLVKQNELQKERLRLSNLIRNGGIFGTVLLTVLIALLYNRHKKDKQINKTLKENEAQINQTNEMLRNVVKEKDWLLKEIHHRVKNNLHMIMSLLNSQSYFLRDKAALSAIQSSQHRIQSMSLIHQKLYMADNLSAIRMQEYVSDLIEYLNDSFSNEKNVKFYISIEDVEMDVSQAVPIGLILNEAITNCFKYAFPEKKGNISVFLGSAVGDTYCLEIIDNGIGLPEGFIVENSGSLGMKLITGLSRDLGGTLDITSSSEGTRIKIDFSYKQLQFGK